MILRLGIAAAQFAQQGRSVHLRHDHVGHHEIDPAVDFLQHIDRLDAVAGFEHGIAARRQAAGVERAQAFLVLDQKDGALAGEIGVGRRA